MSSTNATSRSTSPATPSPPSTSWQKPCVVAIVAASKPARARASRARRRSTSSPGPRASSRTISSLTGAPASDEIVRLLARGPGEEVERRRARLARALAGFDAATIATTHGFCQEVLGGLGVAGDVERDVAFVEDISDLLADVVDDLYVRRFHRGDPPGFDRGEAMAI